MNVLKLSLTVLCLVVSVLHISLKACDEASTTITSTTVNGDGSVTYVIDMCTEYLGLEGSPDAWTFSFFPGTLMVTAFSPATVTTGTGDVYTGVMDDNILRYSTTEIFPSNTGTMFCNTYTITVSGQPDMLIVDYHEGFGSSCEETITFCAASIDNTTVTGGTSVGTNDYDLDFGATINLNSTGTFPPQSGSDPAGIGYAFFTCMPTTALNTPFQQTNILTDPCFDAFSFSSNDGDTNNASSPYVGSEVWILPITLDDNCSLLTDPTCSDFAAGPDTDGDGCIALGDLIHITYLPEQLCDCTTPDCPAGGPYPDAISAASLDCETFNPALTNTTFTTCHTVTSDANGFLGIIEFVSASGSIQCFDDALATRTGELFAMSGGSCTGGPIAATTTNAGNSSTFNPEWNGLSPNTDYVICITMTIAAACDINEVCVDYYTQPQPCGTCVMPDCPIGDVPTYADRSYTVCNTPSSSSLPQTNCYTATSDANGFLGFANIIDDGSPFCFPGDIDIAWELTAVADCGNVIANPVPNANGVSSGFNPEYSGLSPCTDYVMCITYSTNFPFDCGLDEVCVDYYGLGTNPNCDDSDCTTTDSFDAASCMCVNTPVPPPSCDDGDCTTTDTYNTTTCLCENTPVTPPSCDDGDCTTTDTYNTTTCLCENTPVTPPSCDDGDCTTTDTYNTTTCLCENTPVPPPSCDDGDCTTTDTYNTNTCLCENVPVAPPTCDDFDCTTTDTYNTTTCMCEFTPIPPPSCDDNDCTTSDAYNAATCLCENTPIPPPDCDDNDCLTADVYNTQTCMCENNPIAPGSCDDGDCTTNDVYNTTTCLCENTPIPPPDCDDNDCTTDDTYNTTTCMCENTPVTPPNCDDFDCTTTDTYNTTTCMCENTPEPPVNCDDGDCTTNDSYNTNTCLCENTPIPPPDCDDNDCTTDDTYNTMTCLCENTPTTPPNCDDFDCTTTDTYNTTTCLCENIVDTPPSCDDGDCTTTDTYNTNTCMCENVPVAPPTCDDFDCTTNDTYNTTTCMCEFTPIPPPSCDDNDCTTSDTYNAATCLCENTPIPPPDCDDNDCLTADVYNTQTCMCENNPIAPGSCDDGDCTTDDVYNVNTCMCENTPISPPDCDDGDCTTDDVYNTNTCLCENTPVTPPNCDDFDCTTVDSYNTATCMCENTPEPPVNCDDGDCTTDDSYNTNTCMCENTPIPPPDCDDNDCLTADVYNTQTCMCENNPIMPGSCDDGDCTTEDVYNTVTCMCENTPIPPPDCDDNDCTTDDSYNTNTCMCENTPIPPPDCDDNDCTTDDVYNTVTCMCENTPLPPVDCDDNDCSTEDAYNPITCMCENTPITVATATISGDATICEGESATLTLNLTGTAPFTVIYQDQNAVQTTLNGINDGETITVSPTENTVYSLFSVSDAVCDGTVAGSATITVDQELTAPNVFCVSSDENSVTFGWAHPTSTDFEYTISIEGGAASAPVTTTDLTFTQTGLTPGDMVEISVIAISTNSCPNSIAVLETCEANDCPQQTVTIDNLDMMYCADDIPFALIASPAGGEFSGPGTTPGSNIFDPSIAGTGPILITYEYTDPATGCDYQGSAPTEISQALVAPILNCGMATTNSVEFTWTNTGVTQYEFTYSTVLGGSVTQTVNASSYTVFLLQPGETVTASVIALGGAPCGNSPASNEVMCDAEPCSAITLAIDNLAVEYCEDDAAFALIGNPTGGTFMGNGVTGGMFDPGAAGLGPVEIFYNYTDPVTGCDDMTSQFTNIVQQIADPVVFCMDSGVDFVTFEWSDVGAVEYDITVTSTSNGVVNQTINGTTYTENGLAVNEEVTISVIALSNTICGNSAEAETMCTAQDCPMQTVSIDNLNTEYCGNAGTVNLQGTPAGGVFSGDGVTGNIFNPADVTGVMTTILYTYTNPATGCDYTTQMTVTILPPFDTPIVTCGDNTMNSVTFNWTDVGTTLYEVSISVNGGMPVNSTTMDLFWTETGLNPSDIVEISVVAVGVAPCSNSTAVSIECSTEDCVPSTATISGLATVCGGETAFITFNFIGTGPYDVTYLTNGGTPVILTGIFNGHTEAVNPTITSNYTIQVASDAGNANCTVDINGTATVNVTTAISATATVTSDFSGTAVSCAGEADGTAEVTNPTGGTAPYSFVWSNGQTGSVANNLAAGAYEITITDADGCSGTVNVLLDEPTAITSNFILESPLCAGDNNGWIMAENTIGGSEPYLYSLNGGAFQMQDSFPNLAAGVYEISVEDANGCMVSSEETLLNPSPVIVDLGRDTLVVSGTELDIIAQTNVNNLDTIIWTPFEILDTAFNFTAMVTANNPIELAALVIDENGCEGTDNIIIRVNKDRNIFIPNAISPNFDGINDKFIIYGGVGVANINMIRIFDRWGDMVYENGSLQLNSSDEAWDGSYNNQMMNDQVLVYVIEVLFTDGEIEIFKGDLTLMR